MSGPNPGGWTPFQTGLILVAYIGTLGLAGWLGWLSAIVAVSS